MCTPDFVEGTHARKSQMNLDFHSLIRTFVPEMDKILKVEQSSLSFTTRQNSSKLGSALAVLRVHSINDYSRLARWVTPSNTLLSRSSPTSHGPMCTPSNRSI